MYAFYLKVAEINISVNTQYYSIAISSYVFVTHFSTVGSVCSVSNVPLYESKKQYLFDFSGLLNNYI